MTLTILVSFSLLALVVTARPILPNEAPQADIPSLAVQNVVQAIFQSRTRNTPECLGCDDQDVDVRLTSPEEQNAVLSALDDLDSIKGIVPLGLDGVLSDDEKKLYDILGSPKGGGGLDDLDGGEGRLPEDLIFMSEKPNDLEAHNGTADSSLSDTANSEVPAIIDDFFASPPLLVMAISCIFAFLTLGCVAVGLFTAHYIRKHVLASELTWELLPRLEKFDAITSSTGDNDGSTGGEKQRLLEVNVSPSEAHSPVSSSADTSDEKADPIILENDSSSDTEELDEKFHDAEEPPTFFVEIERRDIPHIVVVEEHPDPELLPLPLPESLSTPYSTPPPTPPRSPFRRSLQMREANSSSPVSKPAWSLRAADAPTLGLPSNPSLSSRTSPISRSPQQLPSTPSLSRSNSNPTLRIPGALIPDPPSHAETDEKQMMEQNHHSGRRAYRAPVPELDIAFAMQLRPGLGLGADPAWLVRFLMAMFGWMTVLIGNGGGMRRERRAIA